MTGMPFRIFISHAKEDYTLALRIHNILWRMELAPYIYELYHEYGRDLDEIMKEKITFCEHFVPLITRNGVQSQWVNQEIGMAYALDKNIIPVVEIGIESKGFIAFKVHIPYDPNNGEWCICNLIYRLRFLMSPSTLKIECKACRHEFLGELPSQEEVNKAIERQLHYFWPCEKCSQQIWINPKTLEVV